MKNRGLSYFADCNREKKKLKEDNFLLLSLEVCSSSLFSELACFSNNCKIHIGPCTDPFAYSGNQNGFYFFPLLSEHV